MLPVPRLAFASLQCLVHRALPASALVVALCAPALVGCDSPQGGGQIGGEKAGCYELVSTPLALDEVSPLGFSPADALPTLEGPRTETLLWAKGGDTVLSLEALHAGGETRFVESEFRSYGQTDTPERPCPPAIEIDLDLDFATADGEFAETWQGVARAETAQSATLFHQLDLAALTGTYQVTEVDPADYESVSVSASILFSGQSVSGSLSGQATFSDGERPGDGDGTVGAQGFEVATF